MGDEEKNSISVGGAIYACAACWQVFRSRAEWREHADGPWEDITKAVDYRIEIGPGESIPAGLRAASGECWYPDEDLGTPAWSDVEQGDLVWDDENDRVVGIVGHRDDKRVDVEPLNGGTKTVPRSEFSPDGLYRAIRL